MKKLLALIFIIACIAGCKKDSNTVKLQGDFSFGVAYGFCVGNCAHFYTVKNGQLYGDNMDRFNGELSFNDTPLPNDKYEIAKPLMDSFPQFLLNHSDTTLGCPDCTDGGLAYIEIIQHGVKKHWLIDIQRKPTEIAGYLDKLEAVVTQLR